MKPTGVKTSGFFHRYHMALTRVSTTGTAITLAEAKAHIPVNWDDEDDLIQRLLDGAIVYVEKSTGISIHTSIWQETKPYFPGCGPIQLMKRPATMVEIEYDDTEFTDFYTVNSEYLPTLIYPITYWPVLTSAFLIPERVVITYHAGITDQNAIAAVLFCVKHGYENRDGGNTEELNRGLMRLFPHLSTRGYF